MPRTASEYIIHLFLEGGHHQEVRFQTLQDFQKWYSGAVISNSSSDTEKFINVPMPKTNPDEYLIIRPSRLVAIRVEPVFSSSVERY